MYVNGNYMRLGRSGVSPQEFSRVLAIATPRIVAAIKELYVATEALNPNSKVGSIWLGRLAVIELMPILSESGEYRYLKAQQDRGVFRERNNFTDQGILEYWDTVVDHGLSPEARTSSNRQFKGLNLLATIKDKDIEGAREKDTGQ